MDSKYVCHLLELPLQGRRHFEVPNLIAIVIGTVRTVPVHHMITYHCYIQIILLNRIHIPLPELSGFQYIITYHTIQYILSCDEYHFVDTGLLVIDEEQRFGRYS